MLALYSTLPKRELLAGYAEVVKYGLLGDFDFFECLRKKGTALVEGDIFARIEAVKRSVQAKLISSPAMNAKVVFARY